LTIAPCAVNGVGVTNEAAPDAIGNNAPVSLAELEAEARDAVLELAERADPEAFQALLRLSALVGESLGVNARALAGNGSWAKVAEVAGTTRQAAWARWSS
jgi:hypothetical protein